MLWVFGGAFCLVVVCCSLRVACRLLHFDSCVLGVVGCLLVSVVVCCLLCGVC